MKRQHFIFITLSLSLSLFITGCASAPEAASPVSVQESQPKADLEEYERSKGDTSISIEDFARDKKEILEIISKMEKIMADKNYDEWLKYVDSESQVYWSKPANLRKASNRLPTRGTVTLKSLEDYFTYVFISSRSGRNIDEIRYESENSVQAVEVRDELELVYYNFKKVNGKWKINLPPI